MRRPFEKLVELVDEQFESDRSVTLGELAYRWQEPVPRIGDAIDASKMLRGKRTYIDVPDDQARPRSSVE